MTISYVIVMSTWICFLYNPVKEKHAPLLIKRSDNWNLRWTILNQRHPQLWMRMTVPSPVLLQECPCGPREVCHELVPVPVHDQERDRYESNAMCCVYLSICLSIYLSMYLFLCYVNSLYLSNIYLCAFILILVFIYHYFHLQFMCSVVSGVLSACVKWITDVFSEREMVQHHHRLLLLMNLWFSWYGRRYCLCRR